jgi:hypothetical protein
LETPEKLNTVLEELSTAIHGLSSVLSWLQIFYSMLMKKDLRLPNGDMLMVHQGDMSLYDPFGILS